MATSEIPLQLLNAFQRVIKLLDEPEDIPILTPLVQREIGAPLLRDINNLHQISACERIYFPANPCDGFCENFNVARRLRNLPYSD